MKKKPVGKNDALILFVVAGIWFVTFILDFLNHETMWTIYLLHSGCGIGCLIAGFRTRARYNRQQEEEDES